MNERWYELTVQRAAMLEVKLVLTARAGQPVMLPLTSSVYVNGTLASKESVLVDIGTGYFIEVCHAYAQCPMPIKLLIARQVSVQTDILVFLPMLILKHYDEDCHDLLPCPSYPCVTSMVGACCRSLWMKEWTTAGGRCNSSKSR